MGILPNSRPKLLQADAEKIIRYFFGPHWAFDIVEVAIRGYYANTFGKPGVNDINFYDDALAMIVKGKYMTFNWNADPSAFLMRGVPKAILKKGVHWYKLDYHHKWDNRKRYVALRPATPDEKLEVWRLGSDGKYRSSIGQAINQHAGGSSSTWSEGCQTTHLSQYGEFITAIGDALGYKVPLGNVAKADPQLPLGRFPYILIDQADKDYILGLDESKFDSPEDIVYQVAHFVNLPKIEVVEPKDEVVPNGTEILKAVEAEGDPATPPKVKATPARKKRVTKPKAKPKKPPSR